MKRLLSIIGWLWLFLGPLLVPAVHGQSDVSFGVFSLFHPSELLLEPAGTPPISVHIGNRDLLVNGEPGHRRLIIHADGDSVEIHGAAADRCMAKARDGAPVRFSLSVPGRIRRIYEGKLTIIAHNGILMPVIAIDREVAVATIVASEMPTNAPLEALKAQAVVTRSFLAAGPRHRAFDFCDTTHCQFLRSTDDITDRVRQAVAATSSMVLLWRERPVAALYSSRCGGQTHSLADLGMNPHGSYPYYAVQCPWCREHPVQWQTRLNRTIPPPQPSNESARIAFARQWGWSALPGSTFTATQDSAGSLVEGHSIGHSLGLCQFGAIGLASSGADFRSILAHYFPNSQIAQPPQ
jgi:peptidoglycan hydrolase-like amidase